MRRIIPLFLPFSRLWGSLLLVIFSAPAIYVALVVSLAGCMSAEIIESEHADGSRVFRTKICVVPKSLAPNTKFFATDAKRSVFVSDREPDAFERFVPQADTIFEYDVFAPPSSARLLGASLHLSCPGTFEVLRAPEDVGDGESRSIRVMRIPTETHRELRSMVEQTCKAVEEQNSNQRYVGQQFEKKSTILLGRFNPAFEARVAELLGVERIEEPDPSGPPSLARQLLNTHQGQQIGGISRGITKALIPGGTVAVDFARSENWLPEGTRTGRIAEACGEIGVGVGQIAVGCTGLGIGGGLTGTGGGAPAGVPVFVGSLGLTTAGLANCGNGIRHLTIELWRSDEGDSVGVSSSPASESSRAETAPKAAPAPAPATTSAPKAEPAKLEPYKQGGGHHVPAKKAFEGPSGYAPGYDPQKALAIPNAELKKWGVTSHAKVTGIQQTKYLAFARTGQPLTWEAIATIETEALVEGGMKVDVAQATVAKAIQALKDAGVTAPVRIPWKK